MDAIAGHIGTVAAYAVLLYLLLATACAQVAFKQYHHSGKRSSLMLAIALFVSTPAGSLLAVRQLGVGKVYVLMSLSYALVAFLGQRLFGEKISRHQVQGLALITLGCVCYTL